MLRRVDKAKDEDDNGDPNNDSAFVDSLFSVGGIFDPDPSELVTPPAAAPHNNSTPSTTTATAAVSTTTTSSIFDTTTSTATTTGGVDGVVSSASSAFSSPLIPTTAQRNPWGTTISVAPPPPSVPSQHQHQQHLSQMVDVGQMPIGLSSGSSSAFDVSDWLGPPPALVSSNSGTFLSPSPLPPTHHASSSNVTVPIIASAPTSGNLVHPSMMRFAATPPPHHHPHNLHHHHDSINIDENPNSPAFVMDSGGGDGGSGAVSVSSLLRSEVVVPPGFPFLPSHPPAPPPVGAQPPSLIASSASAAVAAAEFAATTGGSLPSSDHHDMVVGGFVDAGQDVDEHNVVDDDDGRTADDLFLQLQESLQAAAADQQQHHDQGNDIIPIDFSVGATADEYVVIPPTKAETTMMANTATVSVVPDTPKDDLGPNAEASAVGKPEQSAVGAEEEETLKGSLGTEGNRHRKSPETSNTGHKALSSSSIERSHDGGGRSKAPTVGVSGSQTQEAVEKPKARSGETKNRAKQQQQHSIKGRKSKAAGTTAEGTSRSFAVQHAPAPAMVGSVDVIARPSKLKAPRDNNADGAGRGGSSSSGAKSAEDSSLDHKSSASRLIYRHCDVIQSSERKEEKPRTNKVLTAAPASETMVDHSPATTADDGLTAKNEAAQPSPPPSAKDLHPMDTETATTTTSGEMPAREGSVISIPEQPSQVCVGDEGAANSLTTDIVGEAVAEGPVDDHEDMDNVEDDDGQLASTAEGLQVQSDQQQQLQHRLALSESAHAGAVLILERLTQWYHWMSEIIEVCFLIFQQAFVSIGDVAVGLAKWMYILAFATSNTLSFALAEFVRYDGAVACYAVLFVTPYLCDILMASVSLPHFAPHIISYALMYSFCLTTSMSSSMMMPGTAGNVVSGTSHGMGSGGTMPRRQPKSSSSGSSSSSSSLNHPDPVAGEVCRSSMRFLQFGLIVVMLREGLSEPNAGIMMLSGETRLVVAYLLSLLRHGLVLSPVGWVGWSLQVLIMTYAPRGAFCLYVLVVVGLASIRLTTVLQSGALDHQHLHQHHHETITNTTP